MRNFTQAAKSLKVRQPSISLTIKVLERELGTKLFEKLGNKIHLSPSGELLLRYADEILSKVQRLRDEVDELNGLKHGRLRIGGTALPAASFLPVLIQCFKRDNPGVDVLLSVQHSEILEKRILDGELDVAFVLQMASPSQLLHLEPFWKEEVVAIAPPDHPLTRRRSVPLRLVAEEPLIIQEKGAPIRDAVEQQFVKKKLPLNIGLELEVQFGSREAIRNAVANNLGIGFMSLPHVASDVKAGRVKIIRVPELRLSQSIQMAVHRSRQVPLVRTFVDFARKFKRSKRRWQ